MENSPYDAPTNGSIIGPNGGKVVENQHFVPQFYLRNFANTEGLLEILDLPDQKILTKPRPPKSECQGYYFYSEQTGVADQTSQNVEEFWTGLENYLAPKLELIEQHIHNNAQLQECELAVLAELGAMLWMRTPYFREQLNESLKPIQKDLIDIFATRPDFHKEHIEFARRFGIELTYEDAQRTKEAILSGECDPFGNTPHLGFMINSYDKFRHMFFQKKWRFYISSEDRVFITSSVPCIEIFPERNTWKGPSFYERKHQFPLSTRTLVEVISPTSPGKRVKRKRINDSEVSKFNLQQADWSYLKNPKYSRCYAPRKTELEELLKYKITEDKFIAEAIDCITKNPVAHQLPTSR